jgi:hypothetical protein
MSGSVWHDGLAIRSILSTDVILWTEYEKPEALVGDLREMVCGNIDSGGARRPVKDFTDV